MEKKEMTKGLLGMGLKELMLTKSFDKITIRMITDKAGVIRPTFYNYFQDKYDLLEWILCDQVLDKAAEILNTRMEREALKLLFVLMGRDAQFYKKAFQVGGQNSFEGMLSSHLCTIISRRLERMKVKNGTGVPPVTPKLAARYYAMSIVSIIKAWILDDGGQDAEQTAESVFCLMSHSMYDIFYDV